MNKLGNITDIERLILANQYEILSKLVEDQHQAGDYKKLSENLRCGYKWLYEDDFQCLSDVLDDNDTTLVVDILSLYQTLRNNFEALDDENIIINEQDITFKGFDGNNERRLVSFTQALKENERFVDIINKGQINSHSMKKIFIYI